MDILFIIAGILLLLMAFVGCFLPILPGPPLSFAALILHFFQKYSQMGSRTLIIIGAISLIVTIIDYFIPAWGAKKFGGSRYGARGALAGVILGLFLGPFGSIIGPFIGAVAGEMLGGAQKESALKSGIGSFAGFMAGVGLKLIVVSITTFYFFRELIF